MNHQPFETTSTSDTADTRLHHPRASLTVLAPDADAGRSVTVDPAGLVLGRDASSGLALSDEKVSRQHAVVRLHAGRYEVSDLGSTNGTAVNGDPVVGARPVRDGDRIEVGRTEIMFRLGPEPVPPPQQARPRADRPWRPDDDTVAMASGPEPGSPSLRTELKESSSFSFPGLALAVGGAVVGTVLAGAASAGPWGTLAGAAVTPVVTTAFATRRAGEKGRTRAAIIVVLSLAALAITWTGFFAADSAAGKSVIPGGAADQRGTFPGLTAQVVNPPSGSTPGGGAAAGPAVGAAVDCGAADVGSSTECHPGAVLTYNGSRTLTITGVEVVGDQAGEFTAGTNCVRRTLTRGESCETAVSFTPAGADTRTATLLVHQTLPRPDRGTSIPLQGTGRPTDGTDGCLPGFVPRNAVPGDDVCVPPATRDTARQDNALAAGRVEPGGGAFGADTCRPGFVWREVVPTDHVCVLPGTAAQVQQDDALAGSRRAGQS